ncbi:hypothetical protein PIB30_046829 [Stylosanthes scabra]|uniref:Auxin-responsive protein n=1 Tax=Stylosanthes scabra TaxID=79078 RepID=A0ABU6UF78_9FABA|nr:hypothetical protein [Stylosanthes scabra]
MRTIGVTQILLRRRTTVIFSAAASDLVPDASDLAPDASSLAFGGAVAIAHAATLHSSPPLQATDSLLLVPLQGRSIDVTTFKNYEELIRAIECMFGLDGLLNDTKGFG